MNVNKVYALTAINSNVATAAQLHNVSAKTIAKHLAAYERTNTVQTHYNALKECSAAEAQVVESIEDLVKAEHVLSVVTKKFITVARGKQDEAQKIVRNELKAHNLSASALLMCKKGDEHFDDFVAIRKAIQAQITTLKATGLANNYVNLSLERIIHNVKSKSELEALTLAL